MWAVGIMFYEMLTGKHPFYRTNENQQKYVERINNSLYYCPINLPEYYDN